MFNGVDYEITATLDKDIREDGDKVVTQYIDGQQETLLAAVYEQIDEGTIEKSNSESRSPASSARCWRPCCPSR